MLFATGLIVLNVTPREKGLNCLLLRVYFANNPAFILEQNITWQPEIYNIL